MNVSLISHASLAGLLVLALAGNATANEQHSLPEDHPHHAENIVGAKWTALLNLSYSNDSGQGVTLFYERALIPGFVELEVSSGIIVLPEAELVPIELLVKSPFGFQHPSFEPYLGAGVALDVLLEDEETRVLPGLVAVVGSYYWFSGSFGIDLEAVYSVVFEEEVVHEILPSIGIVAHF